MSQRLQVLLVDDNPAIRELMREAMEPLADVHAFASAPEALRQAELKEPDMILSDYRMPGLSGLELLAKLRISFPKVPLIMMAARSDIRGPLAGSGPLVEEFLEKPFFVDEAVERIGRVLERIALGRATREATETASVRGTLAQMSVVDLLQTLDMGRKSCRLMLQFQGQQAEMYFCDGQLIHASMDSLSGEEVVHRAVGWSEGSFLIDFEKTECPRTIQHSTQSVLLEALRRFDEAQRDLEQSESLEFPVSGKIPPSPAEMRTQQSTGSAG